MRTNWQRIWEHVTREFQCNRNSIHGPSHWRRVERNALLIATRSGAVEGVVRLFAVLHGSRREHDGYDTVHGSRAAAYAAKLRGKLFQLSDEHFELLQFACEWHTHGELSQDPTIGTCWDADRLDLGRVGMRPAPEFMSTKFGRELHRETPEWQPQSFQSLTNSTPAARLTHVVGSGNHHQVWAHFVALFDLSLRA